MDVVFALKETPFVLILDVTGEVMRIGTP